MVKETGVVRKKAETTNILDLSAKICGHVGATSALTCQRVTYLVAIGCGVELCYLGVMTYDTEQTAKDKKHN